MAKKPDAEFCTYASVKIDDKVLPIVRAAAALSGDVPIQEYMSDVLNRHASEVLGREPITRRKPKPRA